MSQFEHPSEDQSPAANELVLILKNAKLTRRQVEVLKMMRDGSTHYHRELCYDGGRIAMVGFVHVSTRLMWALLRICAIGGNNSGEGMQCYLITDTGRQYLAAHERGEL